MKYRAKAPNRTERGSAGWTSTSSGDPALPRTVLFSCIVILLSAGTLSAQSQLTVSIPTTGEIKVEATLSAPARSWSFRNAYASALGIAERVGDFRAFGESGQDAQVNKSSVGEFRSNLDATKISYTVRLSEPRSEHLPYVSWLDGERGILMFADLVSTDIEKLSCKFTLPAGWSVESSLTPEANGQYSVSDPLKAVFFIGSLLRKKSNTVDGMQLDSVVSGMWNFKDDDAWKTAARVMEKHFALTGFKLPNRTVVMIAPLPVATATHMWKAETRGSTVVLLVNPSKRKEVWTGQLGVIFTHEMLHLWVPNALKLEGDYDWFFEGFTMYVALRTALELKIIKFDGFLNTLGGSYKYYVEHPDELSLVEASETRWTVTSGYAHVYIKAMLVAFLYDLMVRKESGGKVTLANRYRELFSGGVTDGANGNEAIIRLLASSPALKDFVKSYIENKRPLKLEELVRTYGLQLHWSDMQTKLTVSDNLDPDQKQLLRSLGY